MLKRDIYSDTVHDALEAGSILRIAIFAIDSLEEDLANTRHVHVMGDIRRAVQASAKRIESVSCTLDKTDRRYFGDDA